MPSKLDWARAVVSVLNAETSPNRGSSLSSKTQFVIAGVCQFAVWTTSTSGIESEVASDDF